MEEWSKHIHTLQYSTVEGGRWRQGDREAGRQGGRKAGRQGGREAGRQIDARQHTHQSGT